MAFGETQGIQRWFNQTCPFVSLEKGTPGNNRNGETCFFNNGKSLEKKVIGGQYLSSMWSENKWMWNHRFTKGNLPQWYKQCLKKTLKPLKTEQSAFWWCFSSWGFLVNMTSSRYSTFCIHVGWEQHQHMYDRISEAQNLWHLPGPQTFQINFFTRSTQWGVSTLTPQLHCLIVQEPWSVHPQRQWLLA